MFAFNSLNLLCFLMPFKVASVKSKTSLALKIYSRVKSTGTYNLVSLKPANNLSAVSVENSIGTGQGEVFS